VNIDALIERDRSVGASALLLTHIQPSAWHGYVLKFAPRFVGCDHAYTVEKTTH
jgi:hypothetical protein